MVARSSSPGRTRVARTHTTGRLSVSGRNSLPATAGVGVPAPGGGPGGGDAVVCGTSLQVKIDAAVAGSTLDLTTCNYVGGATINKALTLKGCGITVGAGGKALTITHNDVTVDTVSMTGPGYHTYNDAESGIYINQSAASPLTGIVVKDCTISNFGAYGIYARNLTAPQLGTTGHGNTITRIGYAGIMGLSIIGGSIKANTISHIGEFTDVGSEANAYGIACSVLVNGSDLQSNGVLIDANHVSYVPNWEAFDTHAGIDMTYTNNDVQFSRRSYVFIDDSASRRTTNVIAHDNTMSNPYSPGTAQHPTYLNDFKTFLLYRCDTVTIQNNTSTGFSANGKQAIYDLSGLSIGVLTITPNSLA